MAGIIFVYRGDGIGHRFGARNEAFHEIGSCGGSADRYIGFTADGLPKQGQ